MPPHSFMNATCDIDIAILSVHLSVCDTPVLCQAAKRKSFTAV